jgi:hypothetical protein
MSFPYYAQAPAMRGQGQANIGNSSRNMGGEISGFILLKRPNCDQRHFGGGMLPMILRSFGTHAQDLQTSIWLR